MPTSRGTERERERHTPPPSTRGLGGLVCRRVESVAMRSNLLCGAFAWWKALLCGATRVAVGCPACYREEVVDQLMLSC